MPPTVVCPNRLHPTRKAVAVLEQIRLTPDGPEWLLADPVCSDCLVSYVAPRYGRLINDSDVYRITAIRAGEAYPAPRRDLVF